MRPVPAAYSTRSVHAPRRPAEKSPVWVLTSSGLPENKREVQGLVVRLFHDMLIEGV